MPDQNHLEIRLNVALAYAEKSVEAGMPIHFHVSVPENEQYQLSVYKLGADVNGPTQDEKMPWESVRSAVQMPQPIYPSFVTLEDLK